MYDMDIRNSLFGFVCVVLIIFGFVNHRPAVAEEQKNTKEEILRLIPLVNKETVKMLDEGHLYLNRREYDKAIQFFDLAIKAATFHPIPYFLLAKTYFQLGKDDEAFKVLEKAGRAHTNSNIIFDMLANVDPPLKSHPSSLTTPKVMIAPFRSGKQAAISFMFDDGAKNVYTTILPLFEAYGFRATIPINPGLITETSTNPWWGSWEEWKDAFKRGFEISNHAMEHQDLTQNSPKELQKNVDDAYALIKEKIGFPPLSFVFPQDESNLRVLAKVAERHLAIREHDILRQVYDHIFIPVYGGAYFSEETAERIVDLAILKNLWMIPECHSVATEDIKTYKPVTKEFLEAHLAYIKAREDQIWVDTFINVYLYLMERKNAELLWEETSENSLMVMLKTVLNPEIFSVPLTIVIDVSPKVPLIASAVQRKTLKTLPIRIQGHKLYIEVVPGSPPVEVTWE